MAYDNGPQITLTGLTASADLSAASNQFKFVKLSAAGTVDVCNGATDKPIGVLQNRPVSGEAAVVVCIGVTKVQGDADLAYGAAIGTSADGQAATYSASDTTKYIVGTVLVDNAAAGGYATAVIDCANPRTLA